MQTSFPAPRSAMTFHSPSCRVPRRWPHSEGRGWCHSAAFTCLSSTGRSLVPFWHSESAPCSLPRSLLHVRQAGWARNNCNERLKVWKMHFSNCLIFSFQELCSPSSRLSLTQPGVAQLSQGTTPWLSLHFPHGQKTPSAVKSSGAGAHPLERRFRMVKYLWAAAAEGFWASWYLKRNFEPLDTPWEFWTFWYPMGILLEEASPCFCAQVLHLTQWCFPGTVGHQDVLPALGTDPKWMSFADRWSGERGTQL